jgi:putative restriction endonuclease
MRRGVLSIKTTRPREGRAARYDDQVGSDGYFTYAFQGTESDNHDNNALREAFEDGSPVIYFYGVAPGRYQILFPCFVMSWDSATMSCTIAAGGMDEIVRPNAARVRDGIERRYTTVAIKVRLHQAEFRELVIDAYDSKCAISGLPITGLLEAAHILPDRDERGRPEIGNGLCLSKLHHSAYDQNLLGIDPDGVIHVAQRVLDQSDGPILEHGIKGYHGQRIRLPRSNDDRPNPGYLAEHFEAFRRVS